MKQRRNGVYRLPRPWWLHLQCMLSHHFPYLHDQPKFWLFRLSSTFLVSLYVQQAPYFSHFLALYAKKGDISLAGELVSIVGHAFGVPFILWALLWAEKSWKVNRTYVATHMVYVLAPNLFLGWVRIGLGFKGPNGWIYSVCSAINTYFWGKFGLV